MDSEQWAALVAGANPATDTALEDIIGNGAYSDFECDTPEQLEEGYRAWLGLTDELNYGENEIGPGHCAWNMIEWALSQVDWADLHARMQRYFSMAA